jgi:hypothetical protein
MKSSWPKTPNASSASSVRAVGSEDTAAMTDKVEEGDTAPSTRSSKRRVTKGKKRKKSATRAKAAAVRIKEGPGRGYASPFPPVAFSSVLPFAEAIQEHGVGQPIRRLTLFEKLNRSPESGPSRMVIINSARYGLTKGGYQADFIELTPIGKVATSPDSQPRDKLSARFKLSIESVLPFLFLYERNRGGRVPSPEVLRDSLAEAGVDQAQRKECVDLFLENLKFLGLLRTTAGAERVVPIEQALDEAPGAAGLSEPRPPGTQNPAVKVSDRGKKSWDKTCFVIAPIGTEGSDDRKHSDMVLEALIRRALENEGYDVLRADQITKPGMISGQVVEYLLKAGLVIADLSFHNPNVFYELAIRHMLGKPTVHIIRKGDAIPFDVKDFRTITIDTTDKYELVAKLETYRSEIANHVRETVTEALVDSNPIRSFARGLTVTLVEKTA